jgi:hypothetical protein
MTLAAEPAAVAALSDIRQHVRQARNESVGAGTAFRAPTVDRLTIRFR